MIFKILIFSKNNKTKILKETKFFFLIFWARQGLTLILRILIKDEKSGLRSSLKRYLKKNYLENDLMFWRWTWQGLTLLLRISQWRIKDHVVLKKGSCLKYWYFYIFENFVFFLYFWITWKYVSHDAGSRTDTKRKRKLFLVFLKKSVKRCGRSDRHNKTKENIFIF